METPIRKAESRDLEAVNALLQQVLTVHHKGRPDLKHHQVLGPRENFRKRENIIIFVHDNQEYTPHDQDSQTRD